MKLPLFLALALVFIGTSQAELELTTPDSTEFLLPDTGKIVIKGSDTLGAKMVPQLAEAFMAAGYDTTFEIAAEGSSTAFSNLYVRYAEIGMSSRKVKDTELAKFAGSGLELVEVPVAVDMIGVFINAENPITNLSSKEIESIFTGDIAKWKPLGGVDGRISVYTRNTSSGTYKTFQELAMARRDYGRDTQKMAGCELITQEVAKNRNGIGYGGLAYLSAEGITALKIDGVEPSIETVHNYPLSRKLYFYYVRGHLTETGNAFVEWVTSASEAHKIIEKVGFIPYTEPGDS